MGRPKEFDYDQVLDAATVTFWTDGITKTSISSLVDAMQIQRSSFYNSFASKERILSLVLERYIARSPLNDLINAHAGMEEKRPDLALIDLIMDFSHFLAQRGAGRGCLFFNGLSELSVNDGEAFELYQDYYVQVAGGLSVLLDRLQAEFPDHQSKSKLSLDHLMGIMLGLTHFSKLDYSEQRLTRIGLDLLAGLSPALEHAEARRADEERGHGARIVNIKERMQA